MSENTQQYDEYDSSVKSDDKYEAYKVPFSGIEKHTKDEFDAEHDAAINNPESRHRDKLLEKICDDHPDAPMCKVFDD
ncbi:MAG: hypothetical protein ACPHAS_05915 [Synechococcus sp.]